MEADYRRRQRALRASPLTEAWCKLTRAQIVVQDGIKLGVPSANVDRRTRSQMYRGVYETTKRLVAEALIKPGDRVLEFGAGLGLVSVAAGKIAGPNQLVSYEAVPSTYTQLVDNLKRNNVLADARCRAIADRDTEIDFFVNDDIISSSADASRGARSLRVPADSAARIIAEVKPDVLLMDVEGAETAILPACPLQGVRAIMIQVHFDLVSDLEANVIWRKIADAGLMYRQQLSIGDIWAFVREPKAG